MKKLLNSEGYRLCPFKLSLKMKLTVLLTIVSLFQIQANTYSQNKKISLDITNASVERVINEIEALSEFKFLLNRSDVDLNRKVSIKVDREKIATILSELFANTDVVYEVLNKQIILKKGKAKSLPSSKARIYIPKSNALQYQVNGTIADIDGNPLPGASIVEKGTTNGTEADFDGNFSIKLADANATLIISYIGFSTKEIAVDNQTSFNVILEESAAGLDEVVVVGYGTQKVTNLTGAVDVIDSDLIQNRPSPTVSQLLQGTSPSLTFNVGSFGFEPGANLGIQIRGLGSINGGGSPYIVIDGIPGDLNRLNPEDVESISVLKDAAASAIYGARAPYGVIVVTTKSGKNKKLSVTYSGSVSVASPQNLPSMLNSYTHARVTNEAGVAGAGGRFFNNDIIDNIRAYQAGDYDFLRSRPNFPSDATFFETTPDPNNSNQWGFNQFGNANRDWFDEYYGSGYLQKHDLSISGGSEKTSYYFSAGAFGQEGVLNYGTDTFDRYNIMAKITTALNDNWDFTYQPRYSKTIREIPNMDRQGSYDLIFHQIARTMPTNAKYDGYGNIMIQSKIPWVNDAGTDVTETIENWHTFATEIRPLDGWKINADFAFRNTDVFYQSKELTVYDNLVDRSQIPSGNTVPSNIRSTHRSNEYWTTNIYTSYGFDIAGDHNFSILAGTQLERTRNRGLTAFRTNLLVQEVPSLNTADGEIQASENLLTFGTEGVFGRFNYDYKEKYLLEANARYDGTSVFREGKRWGFFPSFSLGWNVDKELFWEPIYNIVNTFKVRGSWGELGNQDVDSYLDLLLIPLSGNAVNWIFDAGGSRPVGFADTPSLISPDLTWETARTINLGTDLSFLDGKLKANFDWFERTTFDMIGPVEAQPGVLGSVVPRTNNATLRSRGWEINLNWNHFVNQDFSYGIGLNLYDSKAVVTEYENPTGILNTWYEGREDGEIWGYTANDLYRTQDEIDDYTSSVDLSDITGLAWNTGDVKYEDVNGDGVVDDGSNTLEDHGDLQIIGNNALHYQYGINLNANYKGFDISMVWRGVGKRDLWFDANDNIFWGFRTGNQTSLFPNHLNYFRDQPGDEYTGLELGDANINLDAYYPRPYINNAQNNKNRLVSTRYLQNGAYLRLQNVQMGYNFSGKVLEKLNLASLRLYFSGENLFTFSDLPIGIDPVAISSSWGAGKTYGADRIISVGLKVSY